MYLQILGRIISYDRLISINQIHVVYFLSFNYSAMQRIVKIIIREALILTFIDLRVISRTSQNSQAFTPIVISFFSLLHPQRVTPMPDMFNPSKLQATREISREQTRLLGAT